MKEGVHKLKSPQMTVSYLYFYIHLLTEIVCFFALSRIDRYGIFLWMIPFVYDAFAFVPQSLLGYLNDKYPKLNIGLLGVILLISGFILFSHSNNYIFLIILCLGNACIHVSGAQATLRISEGKLAPSAIFVSGGSFGVITGKILGNTSISTWFIVIISLSMIPFILLSREYKNEFSKTNSCTKFNYHNKNISPGIIILLTVFIVIIRGYMGYGIPTSWNKTIILSVLFYFAMGIGKALGGILSDIFGMRKSAILSVIGALPFLLFGDKIMILSLIGIMLFSMTMSITLGLLVSVLNNTPGLAFGLTTIGLFLGTAPNQY